MITVRGRLSLSGNHFLCPFYRKLRLSRNLQRKEPAPKDLPPFGRD